MGIIDKKTYTIKCAQCGTKESASVLDKGSGWGGSSWQNGDSFTSFKTSWSGGGRDEPELTSTTCMNCGSAATVESVYGG